VYCHIIQNLSYFNIRIGKSAGERLKGSTKELQPVSQLLGGPNLNASMQTNTHSMGNKQEELETCARLQGYDLIGITETNGGMAPTTGVMAVPLCLRKTTEAQSRAEEARKHRMETLPRAHQVCRQKAPLCKAKECMFRTERGQATKQ